jgi:ornithine decarboxylase
MSLVATLYSAPSRHLLSQRPDHPVLYFAPSILQATARRFLSGFPGLVTYAVKANDAEEVLENLMAAGVEAFDVASPFEMARVKQLMPSAVLHYNNPVRSEAEVAASIGHGVASYSVDSLGELGKLVRGGVPLSAEVSVRLRLPVKGAIYDFGAKFGADPELAVALLKAVAEAGFTASMTFHPGTQCADPAAWRAYIDICAEVAQRAGVKLVRLNVGGGYAAHRTGGAPDLEAIFAAIETATLRAFGADVPTLVCEPGRAMVAESFSLATRVKAIREDGAVFLNDGIYGGLAELPILGNIDRIEPVASGCIRKAAPVEHIVFGPTCDSLDRLPGTVPLPGDLAEGDWLVWHGLGAYSTATVTRFNGYGAIEVVTTDCLA